jgi:hypothetical protein
MWAISSLTLLNIALPTLIFHLQVFTAFRVNHCWKWMKQNACNHYSLSVRNKILWEAEVMRNHATAIKFNVSESCIWN